MAERRETAPGFIPLALLLRPLPPTVLSTPPEPAVPPLAGVPAREEEKPPFEETPSFDDGRALLQVRLAEWFERARERLLRGFAREVLVRELALAPVDVDLLARQAIAAFADDAPHALAVAPGDVARLQIALPVVADAGLEPGDVALEVSDGRLLSSVQLRVDGVIADVLAEAAAT